MKTNDDTLLNKYSIDQKLPLIIVQKLFVSNYIHIIEDCQFRQTMLKHSKSTFQGIWLRDDKYKSWIKRTSSDTKAKCGWCKTEFEIGKM